MIIASAATKLRNSKIYRESALFFTFSFYLFPFTFRGLCPVYFVNDAVFSTIPSLSIG